MTVRLALSSFYLISMLFLWRLKLEAAGVSVSAFFILTFLVLFFDQRLAVFKKPFFIWLFIGLLMILVLLQGVEYQRFLVALFAWVFLILNFQAIAFAVQNAQADDWKALAFFVNIFLVLHVSIQLAELAGLQFFNNRVTAHPIMPTVRPPGLSVEPSHVALLLSPLIFSSFWPRSKVWGGHLDYRSYVLVYFSLFLSISLTAILVIIIAFSFRAYSRFPVSTLFLGVPISLVLLDISYVASFFPSAMSDRVLTLFYLFESGDLNRQTNVSAAVIFGGYQASFTTLTNLPLGYGLNNMAEAYGSDSLDRYAEIVGGRNIHDGSSMFFKLIVEFGYLGVLFILFAFFSILRFLSSARSDITLVALVFPFFASFARGAGYFDAFVVVGLALLFLGPRRVASWRQGVK